MSSRFPAHLAQTFLSEADELLNQIEEIVLDLEPGSTDSEAINRLFRAFHTIKGSGAMFGFDAVTRFTHHVESALDKVRTGSLPLSRRMLELILIARDEIKALLANPNRRDSGDSERSREIVHAINELLGAASSTSQPFSIPAAAPAAPASSEGEGCRWRIHFKPPAGIAAAGQDPIALLDSLRELGTCTVRACADHVPLLGDLDPEQCYLSWEIEVATSAGLNAIKDVFIFVEDESELSIEQVKGEEPSPAKPAPRSDKTVSSAKPKPQVRLRNPAPDSKAAAGKDSSVRVPSERLDRLVNLVGELVMNQSRLSQVAGRTEQADLCVTVEELERLIAELRDTVLGIRMMPIGTTFNRFKRLVHDLSGELNKQIELVTEGADTELDKTVLDQLGDPLVHLIRNSIDHGIETADDREKCGKPRQGTIRLTAAHMGSNVVITIVDDGHGLDLEKIRAKAIEKRLIKPDAVLTQQEMFNLILLPGFSTAQKVTNVSGRGVGMDVVKKQIDALRGTLYISSTKGQGTTISATLPLTLAIIEGLLVEVDRDQFIIPMAAVFENVELARSDRSRNNGRNVIAVRGELIPYVHLRETFEFAGDEPELEKVVIVRHGSDRVGLVVDRVIGSHQTVIQSLGRFYRDIELLSGATIMGDGRVALIIDVAGLVHVVDRRNAGDLTTATAVD